MYAHRSTQSRSAGPLRPAFDGTFFSSGTTTDIKSRLCSDQTDSNESKLDPPTPRIQLAIAAVHPTAASATVSDPHDHPTPSSPLAATLPRSLPATFAHRHTGRALATDPAHRPHMLGTPQLPTCLRARVPHSP